MRYKIINSRLIFDQQKMKASYFLSDGVLAEEIVKKSSYELLIDTVDYCSNIGGINKRIYVDEKSGIPMVSMSDLITTAPLSACKYVSKTIGVSTLKHLFKDEMIIASVVGTIGDVVIVNKNTEGCITGNNLIKFISKRKNYNGFLYAYLSSKYGNQIIKKLSGGAVQSYVDPELFKRIPIPIFPEALQKQIHNLIIDASELRVEANDLLKETILNFQKQDINYNYGAFSSQKISIRDISKGFKRFDSCYAIVNEKIEDSFNNENIDFTTIGYQSENIFIGPRSKRNYVLAGIPFLSTSAMQKSNPTKTDKFISKKSSEGFIVKEGWLLTTRSGTLGDTIFTLPCISEYAVSEDAIRIVFSEESKLSKEYVYSFLKSKIGKNSLLSGSYGSVVQHLNEDYVSSIKVPVLENVKIETITKKIKKHLSNLNTAILNENKAIDLVEKEIEQWEK